MAREIFRHCHLTISDKVTPQDQKLNEDITRHGFKISSFGPLVIEKDSVTQQEIVELAEFLSKYQEPQENDDFVIISETDAKVSHIVESETKEMIHASIDRKTMAFRNIEETCRDELCNESSGARDNHEQRMLEDVPRSDLHSTDTDEIEIIQSLSDISLESGHTVIDSSDYCDDRYENQDDQEANTCIYNTNVNGQELSTADAKGNLLKVGEEAGVGEEGIKVPDTNLPNLALITEDNKGAGDKVEESPSKMQTPNRSCGESDTKDEMHFGTQMEKSWCPGVKDIADGSDAMQMKDGEGNEVYTTDEINAAHTIDDQDRKAPTTNKICDTLNAECAPPAFTGCMTTPGNTQSDKPTLMMGKQTNSCHPDTINKQEIEQNVQSKALQTHFTLTTCQGQIFLSQAEDTRVSAEETRKPAHVQAHNQQQSLSQVQNGERRKLPSDLKESEMFTCNHGVNGTHTENVEVGRDCLNSDKQKYQRSCTESTETRVLQMLQTNKDKDMFGDNKRRQGYASDKQEDCQNVSGEIAVLLVAGSTEVKPNETQERQKEKEDDNTLKRPSFQNVETTQNIEIKSTGREKESECLGASNMIKALDLDEQDKIHKDNNNPDLEEDDSEEYCLRKERFNLAKKFLGDHEFNKHAKIAEEDSHVTLIINKKTKEGLKFLDELKKLKYEEMPFSREQFALLQQMRDKIESEYGSRVSFEGDRIYIVGMKADIEDIKQKISKGLGHQHQTTYSSTQHGMNLATTLNQDRHEWHRDDTGAKTELRGFQERDRHSASNSSAPVKEDRCVRPKEYPKSSQQESIEMKVVKDRQPDHRSAQNSADCGHFDGFICRHSNLRVNVFRRDITQLQVGAIVNAANRRLQHGSGVARVIAKAGGYQLQKACREFIESGDVLDVTDVFVSPGGNLPVRYVLHAVGPKWDKYDDKKKCKHDLRLTVLRCLVEAAKLGVSSLAVPSISAAIFKVPHEICASSYMEAVKHFDEWRQKNDCPLNNIYFVDVDDTMVREITECFQKYWQDSCHCNSETRDKDFEFAAKHFKSVAKQLPRKETGSSHHSLHKPPDQGTRSSRQDVQSAVTLAAKQTARCDLPNERNSDSYLQQTSTKF